MNEPALRAAYAIPLWAVLGHTLPGGGLTHAVELIKGLAL